MVSSDEHPVTNPEAEMREKTVREQLQSDLMGVARTTIAHRPQSYLARLLDQALRDQDRALLEQIASALHSLPAESQALLLAGGDFFAVDEAISRLEVKLSVAQAIGND